MEATAGRAGLDGAAANPAGTTKASDTAYATRASGSAPMTALTTNPARVLGLEGYGIAPGHFADFVILQATDPIEAIRLRANRLWVVRRGKVIAQAPRLESEVDWLGASHTENFLFTPGSPA